MNRQALGGDWGRQKGIWWSGLRVGVLGLGAFELGLGCTGGYGEAIC